MRLTVVHKDGFSLSDSAMNILLEKESDHVPCNGDLIKDGHTLSAYNVYRVEERIFRSAPAKNGERKDFQQVFLLVSDIKNG